MTKEKFSRAGRLCYWEMKIQKKKYDFGVMIEEGCQSKCSLNMTIENTKIANCVHHIQYYLKGIVDCKITPKSIYKGKVAKVGMLDIIKQDFPER